MTIKDVWFMNHRVRFIETEIGYTASVYTDWGWYDLPRYYCSKAQCRKALWYTIINL